MGKVFVHDQTSKNTAVNRANARLTVNCPRGSIVSAVSGGIVYTAVSDDAGKAVFNGLYQGAWDIIVQNGDSTATRIIEVVTEHEITMKFFEATINITYPVGSTCTCTDGNTTYTAPDTSGTWSCTIPSADTWTLYCTDGSQTKELPVNITYDGQVENIKLAYFEAMITVTYPNGAICSCADDGYIYSASDTSGEWTFSIPSIGAWTVTVTDGVQTVTEIVNITRDGQVENITIKFFESTIKITYPAGATCTCTDGINNFTALDTSGIWTVTVPRTGTWIVKAVDDSNTTTQYVNITEDGQHVDITCIFFISYINVTYPSGSFKVVLWSIGSYGDKIETAIDTSGSGTCRFVVKQAGEYEVGAYRVSPYVGIESTAGDYDSETVTIANSGETASVTLTYNSLPEFTYSGQYKIIDDAGGTITATSGNWNIMFLTSGVFKATALNGAKNGIDVFVLGGGGNGGGAKAETYGALYTAGGGGGGGGYRENSFDVGINENTPYEITIAAAGGSSSAFGTSASGGGNGGTGQNVGAGDGGGTGGSGGSAGGRGQVNGFSGIDGTDGSYPFLETSGIRYGPGGGGGYAYNGGSGVQGSAQSGGKDGGGNSSSNATENSGGGGGGASYNNTNLIGAGKGASGIVIIRNTR